MKPVRLIEKPKTVRPGLPLSAYELRPEGVRKIGIFPWWFMKLFDHDVGTLITQKLLKARWHTLWKVGKVQLFTSKFDDGSYFMTQMNIVTDESAPGGSSGVFRFWHDFLKTVYSKKQEFEFFHYMTIQSCFYWSTAGGKVSSWESFHKGGFVQHPGLLTHQDYEDVQPVRLTQPGFDGYQLHNGAGIIGFNLYEGANFDATGTLIDDLNDLYPESE